MQIVSLASLIAVMIVLLGDLFKLKRGFLAIAILFLILFFGVRTDYGNDFKMYEEMFQTFTHSSVASLNHSHERVEYGWKLFCHFFKGIDFSTFVFMLTTIQFSVMGWFIYKFVERRWHALVLAVYLFWPNLMLTQLSMMRQSLAMSIVICAIPLMLGRKIIWAELVIILAAQLHSSAYVACILPLLVYVEKVKFGVLAAVFLILLFIFAAVPAFLETIVKAVIDYGAFNHYGVYLKDNVIIERSSGIGYVIQMAFCMYLFLIMKKTDSSNKFFILTLSLYFISLPMSGIIGLISRLAMYYQQIGIVALQPLADRIKTSKISAVMLVLFLALVGMGYYNFFHDPSFEKYFMEYHTVFKY